VVPVEAGIACGLAGTWEVLIALEGTSQERRVPYLHGE